MPAHLSFSSLHLQCRLWIAELNADINMLRIYSDYTQGLCEHQAQPALKEQLAVFEKKFPQLRKDIDDLRNDMHLLKMKLATYVRENKIFDPAIYKATDYVSLRKRFQDFKRDFEKIKKDLNTVEENYAQS